MGKCIYHSANIKLLETIYEKNIDKIKSREEVFE